MTVVIGAVCEDGRIVVVSDSAIGYENGYRRIMSDGKWWDMGCLLIGESGSDFALSRIRQKTVKVKDWQSLRDPYTFSELVCQVQSEVKGDTGTEPIEAELMHVSGDENGQPLLNIIGGDGGISGPYQQTAIGHGAPLAMMGMRLLFKQKRCRKRSVQIVTNALLEVIEEVDSLCESVEGPFHVHIFDPKADFQEL